MLFHAPEGETGTSPRLIRRQPSARVLRRLHVERDAPHGNIKTLGDAVWWSFTTITTVGYGDEYPVTTTGRAIAVALMISGIALLGVVTASLASAMINRFGEIDEESQQATRRDVQALAAEVRQLRAELAGRDKG